MVKYKLLRDAAANGRVKIPATTYTTESGIPMLGPEYIYITKKFKKGDIVEGVIATKQDVFAEAGKSLLVKASTGLTTTGGEPYSGGEVELAFDLTHGALELIDENGNVKSIETESFFSTKNVIILIIIIGGIYALLKYQNKNY